MSSCPGHNYSEADLILYFHGGLLETDRRMVNSACGGNILKKTYVEAVEIISVLAEDSRHYVRIEDPEEAKATQGFDRDDYELLSLPLLTERDP